jgi:hypothetical protein
LLAPVLPLACFLTACLVPLTTLPVKFLSSILTSATGGLLLFWQALFIQDLTMGGGPVDDGPVASPGQDHSAASSTAPAEYVKIDPINPTCTVLTTVT